jgi:GNAT superfamily N-acetyltransferase
MTLMIRTIRQEELIETSKIYVDCFQEDYFFIPADYLAQMDYRKEAQECEDWLYCQDHSNMIFGAFDGNHVAGYVAVGRDQNASNQAQGEVCGLFVRKAYRKQGVGTRLLKTGVEYLEGLGFTDVIVYNFRQSASNKYYRDLDGEVVRQEIQEVGGKELAIDIFDWKIGELKAILSRNRASARDCE